MTKEQTWQQGSRLIAGSQAGRGLGFTSGTWETSRLTVGLFSVCIVCLMEAACSKSTSTAPVSYSGIYTLSGVDPSSFVSVAGTGTKSIAAGCLDFQSDGSLTQTILYSKRSVDGVTTGLKEVETWSFSITNGNIVVTDPIGNGSTPEQKTIGKTTDPEVSLPRILPNEGLPTQRTLRFRKLPAGSAANCGLQ